MKQTYKNIFKRCGLDTISVSADSGAMGGSGSEEFMVRSEVGEDTIIECPKCGYVANQEKAECILESYPSEKTLNEIKSVDTPGIKTIEDLNKFLKIDSQRFIKVLAYKCNFSDKDSELVMVLIRGDLDGNEIKIANYLKASSIEMAPDDEISNKWQIPTGFMGPIGLKNARIIADLSVENLTNAVCGANQLDKHLIGVTPSRDFKVEKYLDLRLIKAGDKCPMCKNPLIQFEGIEVGHVFKLGKKYTKSMNVTYLDEDGNPQMPTMGTYGIGVTRTLAAVVEQNYDKDGIIWPMSVAPYHVIIVLVNISEEKQLLAGEKLYKEFTEASIETLIDDREARAGFKFKDADLIGIPLRITISSKTLEKDSVEFKLRGQKESKLVKLEEIFDLTKQTIQSELLKYKVKNQL